MIDFRGRNALDDKLFAIYIGEINWSVKWRCHPYEKNKKKREKFQAAAEDM
jgi:hypothetical protein